MTQATIICRVLCLTTQQSMVNDFALKYCVTSQTIRLAGACQFNCSL